MADGKVSFCGITTNAVEGIVDTAAESGLIGSQALGRLLLQLQKHGLRAKWTSKVASAKGVGGAAESLGVIMIPVGIGGVSGILEATVVQGDVPFLLPVSLLKALRVVLDFGDYTMCIPGHAKRLSLHELPSGHVTVGVLEFGEGPFPVHPSAGLPQEFQWGPGDHVRAAMVAQSGESPRQFEPDPTPHGGSTTREGAGEAGTWGSKIGAKEPALACRNWRALLDKVCTILTLAALQDATAEWCPLPTPLAPSTPSASLPETLEDLYAIVITSGAAVLKPLKSKNAAAKASADCTHPKRELKAGGNATSSYVYCHSRWAMDHRAADLKKYLKDEKGGSLSRGSGPGTARAAMEVEPKQSRSDRALWKAVTELKGKHRDLTEALAQQREPGQETITRYLLEKTAAEEEMAMRSEGALPEETYSPPNIALSSKTMRCLCKFKAKLTQVTRDTPHKGRSYWKCQTGECDFFQWVETASEAAEELRKQRPRSKSPRRNYEDTPNTPRAETMISIDSETEIL